MAVFLLSTEAILATPQINVTATPGEVEIIAQFTIEVDLSQLTPNNSYKIKGVGGPEDHSIDTKNGDAWFDWNGAWDSMPQTESDSSGSGKISLTLRFDEESSIGQNSFFIRIRKDGSSTNYDSLPQTVLVNPTPSPTPTPTSTPTPTQTLMPTTSPSPNPTPTKSPTPTTVPTVAPSPTKSPTPRPTATIINLLISPTPDARDIALSPQVISEETSSPTESLNPRVLGETSKKSVPILPIVLIAVGFILLLLGIVPIIKLKLSNDKGSD